MDDQFLNVGDGRKDPAEYWRNVMGGELMPDAIKKLVTEDPSPFSEGTKKSQYSSSETTKMDRFIKDFDTRHNFIIYHKHAEPKN